MKKQNSVQLRWLKLEGTVNVFELSEFRATKVPQFLREKKSGSGLGQFHYAMIN
jgi:hypothetical protein